MKKGFTLVELLAVILLIAAISFLLVPKILETIEEQKEKIRLENVDRILVATNTYLSENQGVIPLDTGDIIEITFADLKSSGLVERIYDPVTDTTCSGYVLLTKTDDDYELNPQIKCGDANTIDNSAEDKLLAYYTFDDFAEGTKNVYTTPTFNTATSNGGWSHWGQTGHLGSYGQNTDTNYIYGDQTYSHWLSNGSLATGNYLLYQSPAFAGGYRSLTAIIKMSDGSEVTKDKVYPAWNARDGGAENNIWTSIKHLGNGFYLCKVEGLHQDGTNDLVGIYVKAGYKAYFSEVQLEDKDHATPFAETTRDDTVLDYSLNSNNGTIYSTSSPVWNEDGYYNFNGVNTYIDIPYGADVDPSVTPHTFLMWVKNNSVGSNTMMLSTGQSTGNADANARLYLGSHSSNWDQGIYTSGWGTGTVTDTGEWTYIALVMDGSDAKMYANLELTRNISYLSYPWNRNITLGKHDSSYWFNGLIDDVKIYTRALSLDEIKFQYDTSKQRYE